MSLVAVKARKGDALLFFSLHINTTTDPDSTHGSCPVIKGEKWSATRWIHVNGFGHTTEERVASEGCVDENVNCVEWAASGECEKNPLYMVGTKRSVGYCRMSCKVGEPKRTEHNFTDFPDALGNVVCFF
ncbi:hypothetical protein IFM89_034148 [Coptis chinensis]|uniref:procollagen-proline 4-dioxygenase n=1 Tax=Coptis chinensis TaxID=261450 RepID=A0A835HZP6_9MAGN|nr:hypothetical protein IFM89_034148 [Coptis chinensis]